MKIERSQNGRITINAEDISQCKTKGTIRCHSAIESVFVKLFGSGIVELKLGKSRYLLNKNSLNKWLKKNNTPVASQPGGIDYDAAVGAVIKEKLHCFKTNKTFGLFYKIKDPQGNTKGYIWGTAHMQGKSKLLFDQKIYDKFYKSKELVVEMNILNHPKVKGISKEELKGATDEIGGMDLDLLLRKDESKSITELETLAEQNRSIRLFEKEFRESATKLGLFKTIRDAFKRLKFQKEGLKNGSEEKIEKSIKYFMSEKGKKYFYDKRNVSMANKINGYLKKEKLFFIAVGAGHLVGEHGIVSLLRKQGWIIEKYSNPK